MNKTEQLEKELIRMMTEAWNKIGDPSDDCYDVDEKSYWIGRYRAFEDISKIEESNQ